MYYEQFLKIINDDNREFAEKLDEWLASVPERKKCNLSLSYLHAKFKTNYNLIKEYMDQAVEIGAFKKIYIINCPICGTTLKVLQNEDELTEQLGIPSIYCHNCDDNIDIQIKDIIYSYKILIKPTKYANDLDSYVSGKNSEQGFMGADSLLKEDIYKLFYNPDESAYGRMQELRKNLDLDYKTTKEKGDAYELLVSELFTNIKGSKVSNAVRTSTNQIDVTVCNPIKINTVEPYVFQYLSPYLLIECKNEKKSLNNNYVNKLSSILEKNEAQIGILCGREKAATTCYRIAKEEYLISKGMKKKKIIICLLDKDMDYLINDRINLLEYLEFKIFQLTLDDFKMTFEQYKNKLK